MFPLAMPKVSIPYPEAEINSRTLLPRSPSNGAVRAFKCVLFCLVANDWRHRGAGHGRYNKEKKSEIVHMAERSYSSFVKPDQSAQPSEEEPCFELAPHTIDIVRALKAAKVISRPLTGDRLTATINPLAFTYRF